MDGLCRRCARILRVEAGRFLSATWTPPLPRHRQELDYRAPASPRTPRRAIEESLTAMLQT